MQAGKRVAKTGAAANHSARRARVVKQLGAVPARRAIAATPEPSTRRLVIRQEPLPSRTLPSASPTAPQGRPSRSTARDRAQQRNAAANNRPMSVGSGRQ